VLQLILSHLTHGLTLLMASHHNLCNIFALGGCMITIKVSGSSIWLRGFSKLFLYNTLFC